MAIAQATILYNEFANYTFKITAMSLRGADESKLFPGHNL